MCPPRRRDGFFTFTVAQPTVVTVHTAEIRNSPFFRPRQVTASSHRPKSNFWISNDSAGPHVLIEKISSSALKKNVNLRIRNRRRHHSRRVPTGMAFVARFGSAVNTVSTVRTVEQSLISVGGFVQTNRFRWKSYVVY